MPLPQVYLYEAYHHTSRSVLDQLPQDFRSPYQILQETVFRKNGHPEDQDQLGNGRIDPAQEKTQDHAGLQCQRSQSSRDDCSVQ